MRLVVLLALTVLPLPAVDLWTPVIGTGYCRVSSATSSGTLRVTVADIIACGVVNDDKVWVGLMRITGPQWSVGNVHMENSSDTNNLCRTVKNVSGNSFDLYNCDGTAAITASGTHTANTGRVRKVQARTLRGHPRLAFDGPSGSMATMANAGSYWASGRAERTAVETVTAAYVASYGQVVGSDRLYTNGLLSALRWWGEGKPGSSTYKDAAKWGATTDLPMPTTACDETQRKCGLTSSSQADYLWAIYSFNPLVSSSLMAGELSAGEEAAAAEYYLSDSQNWQNGGHAWVGGSKSLPAFRTITNPAGVIATTGGSATVTGTNTNFLTDITVGDYIMIGYATEDAYAQYFKVTAIASNTSLTIAPIPSAGTSNKHYNVGRPYASGDAGWLAVGKHLEYDIFGGGDWDNVNNDAWAYGLQGGYDMDPMHNHTHGRVISYLAAGLRFADTSGSYGIVARWLATDAMVALYDFIWPAVSNWGGFTTQSARGYQVQRGLHQIPLCFGFIKHSFTDSPEYAPEAWWTGIARWNLGGIAVNGSYEDAWGSQEDAYPVTGVSNVTPGLGVVLFNPSHPEAQALRRYISTDWGFYTQPRLTANSAMQFLPWAFLGNRPDVTATQRTNTTMDFLSTSKAACVAVFGSSTCYDSERMGMMSRSDWTNQAEHVAINANTHHKLDHGDQQHEVRMDIGFKNTIWLAGDGDSYFGISSPQRNNTLAIGGTSNWKTTSKGITTIRRKYGTATLAVAAVDITNHYVANVTHASRSFLHLKGFGTVERDDATTSSSQTVVLYQHYWLGGGGCSGCVTTNSNTPRFTRTGVGRMLSSFSGPSVSTTSDGVGYSGGYGATHRFSVGPGSVTAASIYALHHLNPSDSATLPTIVESDPSGFHAWEIQAASPWVVLVAPANTNTATAASITTTHSGSARLAVAGLAAGSYKVQRNGSDVTGCESITVAAGAHVLECAAVASGTIVVQSLGGPSAPTITTSSPLPAGTVGSAYSQTIAATGGTPSYTWSLTSGSCPGLSLSSGGVLSGTPTAAGVCSLTIRCTDATPLYDEDVFSLTINAAPGGGAGAQVRGTIRGVIR